MKTRFSSLAICLFAWFGLAPQSALANAPVEDGTYYISNLTQDGYLGLGAYHGVDPYIYYVSDGQEKTADAYWVVTNTRSGYTFRNEATGQLLVFTEGRVDQYYKYMTLASESPGDKSEYWNIIEGDDGACSIQSVVSTGHYWNLRSGTGMMGTYSGSGGNGWNERYVFHKKDATPDPDPDPDPTAMTEFPEALHVYLFEGGVDAYPLKYVTDYGEKNGRMVIETSVGGTITYSMKEIDSVSVVAPADFPTFESFKFNNKFNDQLFTDALGEMVDDTVFVTVAAICKRLTPSFKVAGEGVEVYLAGEKQSSKVSRLRFDGDVYYLVARDADRILLPDGDEKGSYSMQPYGRFVRVHVDWLTDKAEVPTIYINTSDGEAITSKAYYKDAEITIDGHGIFPSMEATAVQIKGRGNSSWGWAKKPYRLKFASKVKPLGMTKGKSWVLLSNGQTGSLMSNAIGMKAANLMKASAANHIIPVDLYLNGEYRGSYNLTEKVGFSNNSVDLDDESAAALLELDSYYDEPDGQKFRTTPYDLPINIKEPDFSEGTTRLTLSDISSDFNRFMSTLYRSQNIGKHVDLEQLVRFLMVNELTLNYEFYHPKSTFCYRESFESDTSKYVFGPVWDLDWAFGYERYRTYFSNEATSNYWIDMPSMEAREFVRDLRWKYAPLNDLYITLWQEFMDNDLEELVEFCQDYYDFARNSFVLNRQKWGDNTNYEKQARNAASWLQTRSQQIQDDLLSGKRPDMPEPAVAVEFDNDKLYTITCRRGDLILSSDGSGLAAGQSATWSVTDEEKQFAIIDIEGSYFLYSPYLKKFLRTGYALSGEWVDALGSPIFFNTQNADGDYLYMMSTLAETGSTLWFNNNGNIVINSWNTPDDGDRWKIEEAGDFDPTEALEIASSSLFAVTNRYLFGGEVVGEEVRMMPKGALPPEPSDEWTNRYVSLSEPDDMPYQVTEPLTLDYEVEWSGPFTFTTSPYEIHWYNMSIRSDYLVGKQDAEPYYPTDFYDELFSQPAYRWAFGGNPYHVVVYNQTTYFDESLTPDNGMAVMRPGEFAWDLLPNSDGFVLRMPGTAHTCINQFGGGGGPLKFWDSSNSPTDNGSTFRVDESIVDGIPSVGGDFARGKDAAIYDLSGRRVSRLSSGIYIIGGRKVVK